MVPTLFSRNGRLQECAHPFVLVPCEVPIPSPFSGDVPVRSLASLLHFDGHQFHLRQEQLTETIQQLGATRRQSMIPINTPPGATWAHVVMEFANEEYLQISIGKARYTRSFAEMGFADLRKPVPTPIELWGHLRTLAKYDGHIGWDTLRAVADTDCKKVYKWMSEIRQKLQVAFPDLSSDPFEPYAKCKAYHLKCGLRIRER